MIRAQNPTLTFLRSRCAAHVCWHDVDDPWRGYLNFHYFAMVPYWRSLHNDSVCADRYFLQSKRQRTDGEFECSTNQKLSLTWPLATWYAILMLIMFMSLTQLDALLRSLLYNHFSESLTGLATIRAYGEVERFQNENESRMDVENRCGYVIFILCVMKAS